MRCYNSGGAFDCDPASKDFGRSLMFDPARPAGELNHCCFDDENTLRVDLFQIYFRLDNGDCQACTSKCPQMCTPNDETIEVLGLPR